MNNKEVQIYKKATVSIWAGSIFLILLSLFKRTILNGILSFTTVFPLVLLVDYTGYVASYQKVLSFLIGLFYKTTIVEVTGVQLIGLFFLLLFIISIIFSVLHQVIYRYFGLRLVIKVSHLLIVMSIIYLIATGYIYLKDPENLNFSLILVFYLFNMYSIISYKTISLTIQKLRDNIPSLSNIPF